MHNLLKMNILHFNQNAQKGHNDKRVYINQDVNDGPHCIY